MLHLEIKVYLQWRHTVDKASVHHVTSHRSSEQQQQQLVVSPPPCPTAGSHRFTALMSMLIPYICVNWIITEDLLCWKQDGRRQGAECPVAGGLWSHKELGRCWLNSTTTDTTAFFRVNCLSSQWPAKRQDVSVWVKRRLNDVWTTWIRARCVSEATSQQRGYALGDGKMLKIKF